MGEQRWSGDTDRILNAIKDSAQLTERAAQITRDMHQRNEGRLEVMELELRRHTGVLDQYLIKQEAWERLQAEFSGPASFYVQLSTIRLELAAAKAQLQAMRDEYASEMHKMMEQRERQEELGAQREKDEAQRKREFEQQKEDHKNNNYKIIGAIITSVGAILLEIFKK